MGRRNRDRITETEAIRLTDTGLPGPAFAFIADQQNITVGPPDLIGKEHINRGDAFAGIKNHQRQISHGDGLFGLLAHPVFEAA